MCVNPGDGWMREREAVEAAELAYTQWRRNCTDVWDAYLWWTSPPPDDERGAHAAYRAALDREEAAAAAYAITMQRLESLVRVDQC
jgi:hypothetical protein